MRSEMVGVCMRNKREFAWPMWVEPESELRYLRLAVFDIQFDFYHRRRVTDADGNMELASAGNLPKLRR